MNPSVPNLNVNIVISYQKTLIIRLFSRFPNPDFSLGGESNIPPERNNGFCLKTKKMKKESVRKERRRGAEMEFVTQTVEYPVDITGFPLNRVTFPIDFPGYFIFRSISFSMLSPNTLSRK